ncbi:MAG: DUF3810 domain-containing protein [Candidatus Eremiobacteraeota bacterium]|nr:DUF3810 domain-containing protein [Candidatus Eremiobacteraeota bacterium]
MRELWFDAGAVLAALAVRYAMPSPDWIERYYSNGVYPLVDVLVRGLTQRLPFCLGDVLFVAALGWLVRYWIVTLRRERRKRRAVLVRLVPRTIAAACVIFIWFMFAWAYNYGRIPLASKIPVHTERTDEDSVAALADRVVDRLSALAAPAHRSRDGDAASVARLQPSFEATIARLGDRSGFEPPRVKPTLFQRMLQASATTGFTDPWTHEVNLDAGALRFERPAIYAHEWAHVAGFADESEANFISVIACTTSGDPLLAYSGWLLVWFNLPPGVRVTHRISARAYADIQAIRARFVRNVNPNVERATRVAYDRYLKSNRVKAGYASYRLFVRWMTGADFDRYGLPVVRSAG